MEQLGTPTEFLKVLNGILTFLKLNVNVELELRKMSKNVNVHFTMTKIFFFFICIYDGKDPIYSKKCLLNMSSNATPKKYVFSCTNLIILEFFSL